MYFEYKNKSYFSNSIKYKDYYIRIKDMSSRLEITIGKLSGNGYIVCTDKSAINDCIKYLSNSTDDTSIMNLPLYIKGSDYSHCSVNQARVNYSILLGEALSTRSESFGFISMKEDISGVYYNREITGYKEYDNGFILIVHNKMPIVMKKLNQGLLQVFNPYINVVNTVLFKGFIEGNNLKDTFIRSTHSPTLSNYKEEYLSDILKG